MENRGIIIDGLLITWGIFMSFILPIQSILFLIFMACILDLLFGFIASVKENNIKGIWKGFCHFNSGKAKKTIIKILFYLIFVMFIFLMECVLISKGSLYFTKTGTALIVITELKSICESMDIITNKDIFTTLFKRIRNLFINKVSKQITNKNED